MMISFFGGPREGEGEGEGGKGGIVIVGDGVGVGVVFGGFEFWHRDK